MALQPQLKMQLDAVVRHENIITMPNNRNKKLKEEAPLYAISDN